MLGSIFVWCIVLSWDMFGYGLPWMASFMVKLRAHANSVCNWHFCTVENLKGG